MPVSQCTRATAVSLDIRVTEVFRPLMVLSSLWQRSRRTTWKVWDTAGFFLEPAATSAPQGPCLQVQACHLEAADGSRRDKATGLWGSCAPPRPQQVKHRRCGAPGPARRGVDSTGAAGGPTRGGRLARSRTRTNTQTHTHTSRGLGDTGSTASPGSEVGAPGRGQGLTSGPGRAPPGPPSQAGTWPGPSWSPVQPPVGTELGQGGRQQPLATVETLLQALGGGTVWGSPGIGHGASLGPEP